MGPKSEEGLRGAELFVKWIREMGDGVTARDLGDDLFKLFRELNDQAIDQGVTVKGELAIKFKFVAEKQGLVTIKVESKVTQPKKPTTGGLGWLTPEGTFTTRNPKQLEMGALREVVGGRAKRDEDDDSAADQQQARGGSRT